MTNFPPSLPSSSPSHVHLPTQQYDNEAGYSNRVLDLIKHIAKH